MKHGLERKDPKETSIHILNWASRASPIANHHFGIFLVPSHREFHILRQNSRSSRERPSAEIPTSVPWEFNRYPFGRKVAQEAEASSEPPIEFRTRRNEDLPGAVRRGKGVRGGGGFALLSASLTSRGAALRTVRIGRSFSWFMAAAIRVDQGFPDTERMI